MTNNTKGNLMKILIYNLKIAIGLVGLLFSSTAYSEDLNFSKTEPTRYMIKVSDSAYGAIANSVANKKDWFSFLTPDILEGDQSVVPRQISLNSVYRSIAPQYKEIIVAMGVDVNKAQLFSTSAGSPKVTLLKHLQILIVESETLNKESLSYFSDIEFIEEDKYFYLSGDAFNKSQKWTVSDKQLSQILNFSKNSNAKTLKHDNSEKSRLEKIHGNFWALEAIQARKAWSFYNNQGKNTRVMVLDGGADVNHPDLVDNFEKGRNFLYNTSDFSIVDTDGHGTHVAGTVLGKRYGAAPQAKLLVAKVCGGRGRGGCYPSSILKALDWAIAEKVDVLNLSLGGKIDKGEILRRAYRSVTRSGSLVVAASGNLAHKIRDSISYPARYKDVISVGSVKEVKNSFKKSQFSQYSKTLDIVAPGEQILSTVPTSSFEAALTLHVTNSRGKENSFLVFKTFEVAQPGVKVEAIPKASLVLYNDKQVSGKFVLFFLNRNNSNLRSLERKLKSLERRGVLGIFFSADQNYVLQSLANFLAVHQFSFAQYVIPKERGNQLLSSIRDPQVNLSFSRQVQKNLSYYKMTGTSMASPYVAGVMALSKSAKPSLGLTEARSLLHTSAKSITSRVFNGVGAGLVQASDLLSLIK